MPVEIRELIIRAFIEPMNHKEGKVNKESSIAEGNNYTSQADEIAQLLEVINNKNER